MATGYDKLLITHGGALLHKYGARGRAAVRKSLDALVVADKARQLRTKVVLIDSASAMRAVGARRVEDGDWVGALVAVDRAAERYRPAYLALVGATDVMPQARVANPLFGLGEDLDRYVPSDVPYACDLPNAWAGPADSLYNPSDLLTLTRVVGRIPDLVGASDPAMLLAALEVAASYTSKRATTYQRVFALSVAAWRVSTELSVDLLPGPRPTTHLTPPATTGWAKSVLAPPVHFVNCHGSDTSPHWMGQARGGRVDTVALTPEDVADRITRGTVVAAECCYGAMHLAPADIGGRVPMLWAYLRSGAYAAVGSSTTSYGPVSSLGQADLVCRYFLEGVLSGASSGRALLDARQRFVRESGAVTPEDLKTLAQFDLLGDPSLVAVQSSRPAPKRAARAAGPSPVLRQRREVLAAAGRALSGSVPRAGSRARRPGADPGALLAEAGLPQSRATGDVTTFGESADAPRGGFSYHVLPVQAGGNDGFVVSRENDGSRQTTAIFRK